MDNFDLRKSAISEAVRLIGSSGFRLISLFQKVFRLLSLFSFLVFLYGFLTNALGTESLSRLLGAGIASLSLAVIFWQLDLFFELKLKKPKLKVGLQEALANPDNFNPSIDSGLTLSGVERVNLADFLEFETAQVVEKAISFSQKKGVSLNTTFILYSLISSDSALISFVLSRLLMNQKEIQKIVEESLMLPSSDGEQNFPDLLLESLRNAQKRGQASISQGNLLTGLAKQSPLFKRILVEASLKAEDIDNLTWWWEGSQKKTEEKKRFWEYKNLIKIGGLAKSWAAGYTITLDQYAIDWTEMVERKGFEEIVGHEKEIGQIERILARQEVNNVLVVGEAGSGRGAMLQALTQKILFGESLPELNYKRVVELDLSLLINRKESQEEAGAVLEQIFREVLQATNIILIIQDFHNFIGGHLRPGTVDISGTLAAYLRIPQFRLIAVSDFASFHRFIESNIIVSSFEKVEVSEVSIDETIRLLQLFVPGWEVKYKKFISYPALKELVIEADRYLPAIPFPKKATDLMAELLVELSRSKNPLVLPRHVAQIVSEKSEIPVGQISLEEKQNLLNLENLLHERIINQNEAVSEVSSALRRARADITIRKGPMGTFLFLGPTGVGKTETAKALAATYFRSEERMIRLDLSEFQNPTDLKRLIGSTEEESFFVTQVRENPFSLVLLDEIEKAHPNILNLFLAVLDEGSMRDGLGRKVNFLNTIIIATSNAGYQIILRAIEEKLEMPSIKEKLLAHVFNEGIFRPEFINRFDAVVVFRGLTEENLFKIAELMLGKLKKNLAEKGIEFVINHELISEVARLGFDPVFGARQMRRVIQDKIENVLAQALLSGQIKRGQRISLEIPDFKLIIF